MPVLRRANRGEPLMEVSVEEMEEQMAEAEPAPEPETSDSSDSGTETDEKPEADGETEASPEADGSGSQEADDVSELWLLAGTAVLLVLVARSDTDGDDGIPGV